MIENLFAHQIWKRNLNIDKSTKDNILNQIQNNFERHKDFRHPRWKCKVHSTIEENNNIDYSKIIPYFCREYEDFTREIDLNAHQYYIDNIWYNYYLRGYNQEPHTHENAKKKNIYSAVFFLKFCENHPKIYFYNTSNLHMFYSDKLDLYKKNYKNSIVKNNCPIDTIENDFLIFPACLPHGVFVQEIDEPRITISMNFSLEK